MRAFPALLPLLLASTAYAQAPGDYDPEVAPAPPAPPSQPYTIAPPAHDPWAVMANRWSIGFSVGQTKVKVNDGDPTAFSVGELALRYRLRPDWEAELSLGGGDEQNAMATTHTFSTVSIGLRYRIRPAEHFNGFLMAAVGASAVTQKDASSDEQDAATRGHVVIGGGLEYRWTHFALQGEIRFYAMGSEKGQDGQTTVGTDNAPGSLRSTDDSATAGTMTLGASYYF